ncbi:MAG: hypothetical protein IJ298_11150 [Ruminococcus sp.]|nr:hypothetical protein [Ruminococcus sp.]
MTQHIYHSPVICYEVTQEEDSFGISVYYSNHKQSDDPELHCELRQVCNAYDTAHSLVQKLSGSCALPVHIPELVEEFLSM